MKYFTKEAKVKMETVLRAMENRVARTEAIKALGTPQAKAQAEKQMSRLGLQAGRIAADQGNTPAQQAFKLTLEDVSRATKPKSSFGSRVTGDNRSADVMSKIQGHSEAMNALGYNKADAITKPVNGAFNASSKSAPMGLGKKLAIGGAVGAAAVGGTLYAASRKPDRTWSNDRNV